MSDDGIAYVCRSASRRGIRPGERGHSVEARRWCVRANAEMPWLEWQDGGGPLRLIDGVYTWQRKTAGLE